MLNLSQRLILGCVLLACLTAGWSLHSSRLAAAGQTTLAYAFVAAALLIAVATVYFVLSPIRVLAATPTHRPGQSGAPCGVEQPRRLRVLAGELSRIAVRLRVCATQRPAAARWSFSSPTRAPIHLRAIIVTTAKATCSK